MAIKNINTIQNPDDLEFIKQASNEYVLQSLANLGQRIGLTGDGVKVNDFSFSEIVNGSTYSHFDYVGYMEKKGDSIIAGIKRKSDLSDVIVPVEIKNTDNYIITTSEITLETEINGVEGYSNGTIICDENYYTCSFTGKTNDTVQEYICEKFDKLHNIIYSALRLTHYQNKVTMFYLFRNADNTYTLWVAYEQKNATLESYIDYISGMPIEGLSPEYIVSDYNIKSAFANPSLFNGIVYSKETNKFILPDGTDTRAFPNLKHYVQFYIYDLTYLYRFIKEYYSEIVYKDDNLQFKRQIFTQLFRMIIENSTLATEMYVPLDYKINYACNTGNEWQIYYNTQDIIVKYMPNEFTPDFVKENSETSSILCYTDKEERATLYNFSVDYDPENSATVYGINVFKHYTLPYVNADGYWVLNDVDSQIYAKGMDAGNPNIIIVESHEDTYTVVSGANKQDILAQIDWERKQAYVQPLEKVNINDLKVETQFDWFKVNFWVPSIQNIPTQKVDEWLRLLQNSLIINIADLSCIDYTGNVNYTAQDVVERYGRYGVITTMWVLNDGKTDYDYLRRQDNAKCAADFNYITNMNNLINWAIYNYEPKHPDKYHFTYLTFDASYVTLKNNTSETRSYIYPNISNKESKLYNALDYNNDFNFIVKYNDLVEGGEDNNITNIQQSATKRYYDTSYNAGASTIANVVTNSLYSYTIGKSKYLYEEYIPNYNVPGVDLGEVLTRNETLLNRLNILSFDKYGTAYYSYIGTSYDLNKNKFVVGTSTTNINMGSETLIDTNEKGTFIKQSEFDINFDNTFVAGNAYVGQNLILNKDTITYGLNWVRYDSVLSPSCTITYWSTSIIPTGRYIYEMYDNYTDDEEEATYSFQHSFAGILNLNRDGAHTNFYYLAEKDVYDYAVSKNKIYTICTLPELYQDAEANYRGIHSIYIGDGLYIPALLNKLGLSDWITVDSIYNHIHMPNVRIGTRNMTIYKYDETPLVIQSSSTILYPDMYRYITYEVTDEYFYGEEISDFTYSTFKGNELNITYYVSNNILNINIDECASNYNMSYVNTIITDYKNYLTD